MFGRERNGRFSNPFKALRCRLGGSEGFLGFTYFYIAATKSLQKLSYTYKKNPPNYPKESVCTLYLYELTLDSGREGIEKYYPKLSHNYPRCFQRRSSARGAERAKTGRGFNQCALSPP